MKSLLILLIAVIFTACQAPIKLVEHDPMVIVNVAISTADAEYATYLVEDSDTQFEYIAPTRMYEVGDTLVLASPRQLY